MMESIRSCSFWEGNDACKVKDPFPVLSLKFCLAWQVTMINNCSTGLSHTWFMIHTLTWYIELYLPVLSNLIILYHT